MTTTVERLHAKVDADVSGATRSLTVLKGALVGVAAGVVQSAVGVGAATAAALGPVMGLLGAIPLGVGTAVASMGTLAIAMGGVTDALGAQSQVEKATNLSGKEAAMLAEHREQLAKNLTRAIEYQTDAQKALNKALEPAKMLDMREAELSLRSARLSQSEAVAQATKIEQDYARVRQQVMRSVIGLKDDFTGKTIEFVSEVRGEDTVDPLEMARKREAAAIRIEAAEIGILRAQEQIVELRKQGREDDENVIAARRALRDATENVLEMQKALNRAQQEGGEAGAQAVDQYAKAMKELAPSAQEFVTIFGELKPLFKDIKAEVQQELFLGINEGIKALIPTIEVFGDGLVVFAGVFSDFFELLGKTIGTEGFMDDVPRLFGMGADALDGFLGMVVDLVVGFKDLAIAAEPLTSWLADLMRDWGAQFRDWASIGRETGELTSFFERTVDITQDLFDIFGNLYDAFKNFGTAIAPISDFLIDNLVQGSENFQALSRDAEVLDKVYDFVVASIGPWREFWRLIKDVGAAFFELKLQDETEASLELIREKALPAFVELITAITEKGLIEGFVEIAVQLLEIATNFTSATHGVEAFLDVASVMLGILDAILSNELVQTAFQTFSTGAGYVAALALAFKGLALLKIGAIFGPIMAGLKALSVGLLFNQGLVASLRMGIAAMGGGAVVGAVFAVGMAYTHLSNKIEETKEKADGVIEGIRDTFMDAAKRGDVDKLRRMIEEANVQLGIMAEEGKNVRGAINWDYEAEIDHFAAQLGVTRSEMEQLVAQAEFYSEATGSGIDQALIFAATQYELNGEFGNANDQLKIYNDQLIKTAEEGMKQSLDQTINMLDAQERLRRSLRDLPQQITEYNETWRLAASGNAEAQADMARVYDSTYDDIIGLAKEHVEAIELERGAELTANEERDITIEKIKEMAAGLDENSPLRNALLGHIVTLENIPDKVYTQVQVDLIETVGSQFVKNFDAIIEEATARASGAGSSFSLGFGGGKSSGGVVEAGKLYRVNEHGTELFIPNQDGRILPAHTPRGGDGVDYDKLAEAVGRSLQKLPPREQNLTFNNQTDPKFVADELMWSGL